MNLLDLLSSDGEVNLAPVNNFKAQQILKDQKKRSRNWSIICYEDEGSELNVASITDKILDLPRSQYIAALHEHDVEDDGVTPKKVHWHVLFRTPNAYTNTGLVKFFHLKNIKQLEPVSSWKKMMRYFIHLDDIDKYQYKPDQIALSSPYDVLIADFYRFIEEEGESTSDSDYIRLIYNLFSEGKLTNYESMLCWSLEQGYYSLFRKSQRVIENLLRFSR